MTIAPRSEQSSFPARRKEDADESGANLSFTSPSVRPPEAGLGPLGGPAAVLRGRGVVMTTREGSLEAPTRHAIDWKNPEFYDEAACEKELERVFEDRKSTRLNSSHGYISYAVF